MGIWETIWILFFVLCILRLEFWVNDLGLWLRLSLGLEFGLGFRLFLGFRFVV